jgi:hypothetical protein
MKFSKKQLNSLFLLSPIYSWAKREELYTSKQNLLFWGASIFSIFFSDGPIKLAHCKKNLKKDLKLGGTSSN